MFRCLSVEELKTYISMVVAYKIGPYATTHLRICMNSSMKQPQPSGVSLNDCLTKGPPALSEAGDPLDEIEN